MAAEENKTLHRRVLEEVFNRGNLEAVDELFAPEYVDHDPATPQDMRGSEGAKQIVSMYRGAFPA